MNRLIYRDSQFWVTVDKDSLMVKKESETATKVFIEDMTKLLDDPETSDYTLKCGSKIFKAHKAILGARSRVFRAMFLSGMKETLEGEVVIEDLDEKILEEVLFFLYTGKLSGKEFGLKSLCYAANKYELESLMDMICDKIRPVKLEAEELADLFVSAEMFNNLSCMRLA